MHPVLLCYDGSEDARRAIQTAGHLLPERRAIVVHVSKSTIDWGFGPALGPVLDMPDVDAAIIAEARKVLDQGVRLAELAGFHAVGELHTTGSAVWRTILAVAARHEARLIVAGSHGQRLRDHLALGSVAHGLVAHADVPLLITHRGDATSLADLHERRQRNVLIAYDGSDVADDAVDAAAELLPGARARILTAWETPVYWGAALGPDQLIGPLIDVEADVHDTAVTICERGVVRAHERGLDPVALPLPCERGIGTTIIDASHSGDTDLVVLGTHGHSPFSRAMLGTTAHFVVQHADLPVLVVPLSADVQQPARDRVPLHAVAAVHPGDARG